MDQFVANINKTFSIEQADDGFKYFRSQNLEV